MGRRWPALTALVLCAALAFAGPVRRSGADEPPTAPGAAPAAASLRVGFGTASITPDWSIPLGGFGNRLGKFSTGIHDPVKARAVLIDNGTRRFAWVVVDLVGVSRQVRNEVYDRVGAELRIDRECFTLSATHDHSGPGGLAREIYWQIAMGPYDPKLYRYVLDQSAAALRAADRDFAPARLGIGVGKVTDRSRNRRIKDGPIDPQMGVIRVDRPDGTVRGLLVNFACHPTILGGDNMQISADFPGALCDALEARLGPGGHAIFANADEGDQGPQAPDAPTAFDRVKAQGEALAADAWKIAERVPTSDQAFLKGALREIKLPLTLKGMIGPRTTLVQTVQIQETVLVMIPGEMCVGLGLPLREKVRALGPTHVLLIGLANDHLAYFVTPEMLKAGGYEADMNFYGPNIGRTFERAFERLLVYEEPWGM